MTRFTMMLLLVALPALARPAHKAKHPVAAKPVAAKQDAAVDALVKRMQAFYENTKDFTADFTQRYTYVISHRTQVSHGKVMFKKPGLMRWDYTAPAPRTFLLSGDTAYALDPQALTLTRSHIDQSQLSAAVTFLLGKGNLADEFTFSAQPCKSCKGTLVQLTPKKPDARFKKILLEVDPKTAQVLDSSVVDPDGSVNRIEFEDLKTNVGLEQAQFQLNTPPNTQVIDMTQGH